MTRRVGFWVGWGLLSASLVSLFVGDLSAFGPVWGALVVGSVALGTAGADRAIGRAMRPQAKWWLDAALVLLLLIGLGAAWGWFLLDDLEHSRYVAVLLAIPAGAIGLPLLRFVGEGRPAGCFWPLAIAGTAITTLLAAALLRAASGYGAIELRMLLFALGVLGMGWAAFVVAALVLKLLGDWPDHRPPRRWLGTALAGALVATAHVGNWTWLRQETDYFTGSDSYMAAVTTTTLLLCALGPVALAALLGGTREVLPDPDAEGDEPA